MGKTRGMHETTPELRNRMVGMYEAGLALREIAAAVNCSPRTVKRWLNRFDKEGTVETRERCGRKRATTVEQDEAIIKLAIQTPITAAKAVLPALGLSCSVDTIRERLHKAGIHNWSPSRKHIQKIPLGDVDGAAIQQAVWRPTGTSLGKKKNQKSEEKQSGSITKKIKKSKSEDSRVGDGAPAEPTKQTKDLNRLPDFAFSPQETPPTIDVQPAESQLNNQTEYGGTMGLALPSHHTYSHHLPNMNVIQSWPLDLVQGTHQFPSTQSNPIAHEPPPQQHLQELHTQREQEQLQDAHNHENNAIYPTNCTRERSTSLSNYCSTDKASDLDDKPTKNDKTPDTVKEDMKKKGGKAKGTLETSLEIRNRMIGMAEAGLSTLSIALAINRSERTVKRWLERWNKEGNVQTKERKGRRRSTTKEQDQAIIAMATLHPLTAAKHVAPALGLNCSVDTIRERLHKAGIHSWKLGKKQGEGNAVHTVHLWQPSGNRPNKPKLSNDERKKSSKKTLSGEVPKRSRKKKSMEATQKIGSPTNLISEQSSIEYHETTLPNYPPQPPGPTMMQSLHIPAPHPLLATASDVQGPSEPSSMQPMGPMMQQRSDCRLAPISGPTNNSLTYSSCMVTNNTHMEHADPLNYEPFIWTF